MNNSNRYISIFVFLCILLTVFKVITLNLGLKYGHGLVLNNLKDGFEKMDQHISV